MRIEIGEWHIRSFRLDDAAALARNANNRNVWRNLRDAFPHPYTRADAEAWISSAMQQTPETNFAVASPSEAIGGIGLRLRKSAAKDGQVIDQFLYAITR